MVQTRGLVKQHIDSFNYFVNVEIKKIMSARVCPVVQPFAACRGCRHSGLRAECNGLRQSPACLVCRPARVWLGMLAPANTDLNSRCECGTPVHICPSASPLQRFIAFRTLRTKS
jgi:hypothetical protein